jgi:hypothetical protein
MKRNQYVIVRCSAAGVHAGVLVSKTATEVVLKQARRMWRWFSGFTLSEAANDGIVVEKSRIGAEVPEITLSGWCEIIPCSAKAEATIRAGTQN